MSTAYGGNEITFPDNSVQNTAPKVGMVNRVINSDMRIDQRNAGASVTPSNVNYTLDRWYCVLSQPSKFSVQQNAGGVTAPDGFTKYLGCTSLSAYSLSSTEQFAIRHAIEGNNIADLGWGTANAKTVTLSFWVRSSLTGTFGGAVKNSVASRSYPFSYTISSANTWEQKAITIAGDTTGAWLTTTDVGIMLVFALGAGSTPSGTAGAWAAANYSSATGAVSVVGTSGATFYLTGVQLEKGSTATDFEYVEYSRQLQMCQRYCFSLAGNSGEIVGIGFTGTTVKGTIGVAFPVEMRALPTLVSSLININDSQAMYTGTAVTLSYSGALKFNALAVTISGGVVGRGCQAYWAANNSKAIFSAEL
jgi:hypothetical protein